MLKFKLIRNKSNITEMNLNSYHRKKRCYIFIMKSSK